MAIWMRRRSMRRDGRTLAVCPFAAMGSNMQVRLLVLADRPPPGDLLGWVRGNDPDAVVLCGDLDLAWIDALGEVDLPKLGVYGNHDGAYMAALGITDLHLRRVELDGVSFAGFEGCVRYREGPHQYTQEEASALARGLPPADVLVCHAPPAGINDEPGDRAHEGFDGLREWVRANVPRLVLHGHTHPRPGGGVRRVGSTQVLHVSGARIVEASCTEIGAFAPRTCARRRDRFVRRTAWVLRHAKSRSIRGSICGPSSSSSAGERSSCADPPMPSSTQGGRRNIFLYGLPQEPLGRRLVGHGWFSHSRPRRRAPCIALRGAHADGA